MLTPCHRNQMWSSVHKTSFFLPLPPQLPGPMLSTPEQHSFQVRHQGRLLFGERHGGFGDNALKAFLCCPPPPAAAFTTTRTASFYLPRTTITSFQATRQDGSLWPHRQLNHHVIYLFSSFLVKKHTRETCKSQLADKPLRQHWQILQM